MPYFKRYKLVVIGFDGALASAVTGALDIFSFAGISWQRLQKIDIEPRFSVSLASLHGKEIHCSNRLVINTHEDISEIIEADIVLIPTIGGDIDKTLRQTQQLIPHIRRLAHKGADIASNCSGAFLLANAGLLDHKSATTHWGYINKFKSMFPLVNLEARELITQSDNIFCAGGGVAFNDLCLMLIERYCGREVANQVAKAHVINRQSGFQTTYANLHSFKSHKNESVQYVQEHIEAFYDQKLSVKKLASLVNLTERTLHRNFQKSVGMSPLQYLQSVRIENAKRMLEQSMDSIQQICGAVAYDDQASFSRLFKKSTGLTPKQYRTNFQRNFTI